MPRPRRPKWWTPWIRQTQLVAREAAHRVSVEVCGPLANLMAEFMARQAALEDHCGFVYVAKTPDAPQVTPVADVASTEPTNAEGPE